MAGRAPRLLLCVQPSLLVLSVSKAPDPCDLCLVPSFMGTVENWTISIALKVIIKSVLHWKTLDITGSHAPAGSLQPPVGSSTVGHKAECILGLFLTSSEASEMGYTWGQSKMVQYVRGCRKSSFGDFLISLARMPKFKLLPSSVVEEKFPLGWDRAESITTLIFLYCRNTAQLLALAGFILSVHCLCRAEGLVFSLSCSFLGHREQPRPHWTLSAVLTCSPGHHAEGMVELLFSEVEWIQPTQGITDHWSVG